jgi:uncharacterized membrane protein
VRNLDKLVAIVYPDMGTAEQVYLDLQGMQKEHLIEIHDAAWVVKDTNGKIKLHQETSMGSDGALAGGFWGFFIGLLFFAPILGLLLGAGTGALVGKSADYGIDDKFMKNISKKIQNGNSAVFVLASSVVADKVIPEISKYGGEVLQTSLSKETEQRLQKALSEGQIGGMQAA